MFYSSQIIYVVIQETAKISMIFLYIRVFTSRWFTNACYMAIVFILLNGAAYIFALAFQCRPVSALWDPLLKGKGQCLNLASLSVSGAVCSIVDDLVILILPIPEIMKLKMSKNKKWGLVLMFSIGSLSVSLSLLTPILLIPSQRMHYKWYQVEVPSEFWIQLGPNM